MAKRTYKGEKNNREKTEQNLIAAVGRVLENKGYTGLTAVNIAKEAGVDRKLIPLYFGSLDNLIELYIKGKDFWAQASIVALEYLSQQADPSVKGSHSLLKFMLMRTFDLFPEKEEIQKITLWQITESSELMDYVAAERERVSALVFGFADKELENPNIDVRAISSLLLGGIYHLVLHSKSNKATFCEIDLSTEEGMNRIRKAILTIIDWVYERDLQLNTETEPE